MDQLEIHRQTLENIEQIVAAERENPALAIRHILSLVLRHRMSFLTQHVIRACAQVVQSGPFAGMRYLDKSAEGALLPKLLGSYEAELHGVLTQMATRHYNVVINIGCGEGYYAVGLARLMPAARVHAFDTNAIAQDCCRQLARINNVADRVIVTGECGTAELEKLAGEHTLIFCDCEGSELRILDPRLVPGLVTCDIVVELHDFLHPGTSDVVPARFEHTHDVMLIQHCGRDPYAVPVLRGLRQLDQLLAVWEFRPGPTPWAFMTSRSRHNTT